MKTSFSLLPQTSLELFLKQQVGLSGQWIKRHSRFSKELLKVRHDSHRSFDCEINLINAKLINPIYDGPEIEIIDRDLDLMVLNKPANIHGHPLSYQESDNVLSYLRSQNYFAPLSVNTASHERGLLYRLDFETSGVLIVANNQLSFNKYFHQKMKKKLYFAAISPGLNRDGEIIAFFKPYGPKGELMQAHPHYVEGSQEGLTKIQLLSQSQDFDLIALELFEGHRHQLRSLMAMLGHPILGDDRYGGQQASRLMLHASQYIIQNGGEDLAFMAPLRGEFEDLLNLHGLLQVFHDQFDIG